jgi:predicted deacylase
MESQSHNVGIDRSHAEAAALTRDLRGRRAAVELARRDLSAFRAGNTGVDYVFSFDSGRAGPHVVINGLTHGNEPCGAEAVIRLLEDGVRPARGRLTLSLANVRAYEAQDDDNPYGRRFVDENLNRVWSDAALDGDARGWEYERARALRPVFATADWLLDIHSTPYDPAPFFVTTTALPKQSAAARALGSPRTEIATTPAILAFDGISRYGRFGDPADPAVAVLVECGLFFARESAAVAHATALRLLAHSGVVPDAAPGWHEAGPPRRVVMAEPVHSRTGRVDFGFAPSTFETFARGTICAWDGDEPIRAPFDGACPIWTVQRIVPGGLAFVFARIEP